MGDKKVLTKKYTISITEEAIEMGKELSVDIFGKENFSGYVTYLIYNQYKRLKKGKGE